MVLHKLVELRKSELIFKKWKQFTWTIKNQFSINWYLYNKLKIVSNSLHNFDYRIIK